MNWISCSSILTVLWFFQFSHSLYVHGNSGLVFYDLSVYFNFETVPFNRQKFGFCNTICNTNTILKKENRARALISIISMHRPLIQFCSTKCGLIQVQAFNKCVRLNIMQQNGHISSANTGTHIPHLTAVYWFMNVKCVWQFSVWLVVDFPFGNCHCNCYAIQYTNYPSLSPFLSLSLSIFHLIWCNFLFSFNPIDIFVWNIQRKFIYWFWPHFVASFSLTSKWMFHQ